MGYSPWGCKESDTTERLHFHFHDQTINKYCVMLCGLPVTFPNLISFNPNSFMKVKSLSCVRLFAVPWTAAHQAPPPMGFSWQEYWSGLSFPSPGDLPNPGIKPRSPALQADALTSEPPGKKNLHSVLKSREITLPTKVLWPKFWFFQ